MSTDCNINVTAEVTPSPIEVTANLALYVVGGSGVPDGGTTGQHLAKLSDTDGDTGWEDAEGIPAGGTAGQTLTKIDGTDYNADWQDAGGGNPFDQDLNTTDQVTFERVGAGTPSPLAPLHVTGGARLSGLGSSTEDYIRAARANGSNVLSLSSSGGSKTILKGDTTFAIESDSTTGIVTLGGVNGRAGIHISADFCNIVKELEISRTTTPSLMSIYNTKASGTDYERLRVGWVSNMLEITTEASGTGTQRELKISGNQKGFILESPNGTEYRVTVDDSGSLITTAI